MSLKTKPKIFVDLDGVITDFVMPAMAFHEAEIEGEQFYPIGFGWDVLGATNLVRQNRGLEAISATTFWDGLGYEFWRSLRCYPLAPQFLQVLESVGDVYFATSPTLSSECVAGKFDWIKSNFRHMIRKFFIGADKSVFAGPGAILIDDRDKNVDEFREAGGQAFLIPRPWNRAGHCQLPRHPYDNVVSTLIGQMTPRCTCHERDSSYTCDVCKAEGYYGHMETGQ